MKKFFLTFLLAVIAAAGYGQDVVLDLTKQSPTSGDRVNVAKGGVTFDYAMSTNPLGAYLYNAWESQQLKLTSSQGNIQVVELVGVSKSGRASELYIVKGGGDLNHVPDGVSVWKGGTNEVTFGANSGSTYIVQKVRVWFDADKYVPGGSGDGEDEIAKEELTGSPVVRTLSLPKNGVAVKMAIVTVKQFEKCAQEYALWKTQQGYDVTELYVEDFNQGGSLQGEDLAKAIQAQLKQIGPAFVLIMGDDYYVPTFKGTFVLATKDYATDYFYGEYTGDNYPEAYVGRFSADTEEHLRAQMNKTKYMAQLSEEQGEWLETSVALQNPSTDIAIMQEGHKYAANFYRAQGAVVKESSAFSGSSVNNWISEGCAVLSYFGHGLARSFNTSSYTSQDAKQLQNANHYPLVLAITCLTGQFDNGGDVKNPWREVTCLAEEMQRRTNAGSVAYIGATRESFDTPNMKFMIGGKKDNQSYLGLLASLFPLTDEDPLNQHARTLGEAMAVGANAVSAYQPLYVGATAEYYELFGDPTYQPYIRTPKTMSVSTEGDFVAGHLVKVKAVPNAVVCLSQGREIVAVGATDARGKATLKLSADADAGNAVLYASAPGYTDWQTTVALEENDGKDVPLPGIKPELVPIMKSADEINHTTAQTKENVWQQANVAGHSGANYATMVSGDGKADCVLMINNSTNYDQCGIVTTQSGGYVRQVKVDWLQEHGFTDCISVYGSNTAYTSTSDVWNKDKQGTLIGQIKKGGSNTLVVPANYTHVALRAETPECKLQNITIGWGDEVFDVEKGDLQPSAFDYDDFTRKLVLIEKFTGLNCPNCPIADTQLNGYLDENDLHDKVYEMRHYSFSYDQLSPSFYNDISRAWRVNSYPIFMVDRGGYKGNKSESPTLSTAMAIKNNQWVESRFEEDCKASISLDGSTFNPATRELNVVVSGKVDTTLPDLRMNIFLTQNNIVAYQSGATNASTYVHNGVARHYLTEALMGDVLRMEDDGTFQMEYTCTVEDKYARLPSVIENMDVVAFVSSWDNYDPYTGKNFENSMVHNADALPISMLPFYAMKPLKGTSESTTAVSSMSSGSQSAPIFNLQGQQIPMLQRGVNIVGGRKIVR